MDHRQWILGIAMQNINTIHVYLFHAELKYQNINFIISGHAHQLEACCPSSNFSMSIWKSMGSFLNYFRTTVSFCWITFQICERARKDIQICINFIVASLIYYFCCLILGRIVRNGHYLIKMFFFCFIHCLFVLMIEMDQSHRTLNIFEFVEFRRKLFKLFHTSFTLARNFLVIILARSIAMANAIKKSSSEKKPSVLDYVKEIIATNAIMTIHRTRTFLFPNKNKKTWWIIVATVFLHN